VISADVRRKTLLTATGETISYKTLIIATGARVLDLFVLLFSSNYFRFKFNSS
jgi:NADH dehydrogenase FAD-containing subunit